jgi:type III restriction enzyme
MDNELKVLETFYNHTVFNSEYISEIRQALRDTGIIDEKEQKEFKLELKESFKEKDFYKNGIIYTNKRVEKDVK